MKGSGLGFATLALLVIVAFGIPAAAQFNASVQGTVTDTTGGGRSWRHS